MQIQDPENDLEPKLAAWSIEELASLRSLPRFAEAVRHSTLTSLAHYDEDPGFSKIFNDVPTMAIGILAIYLDGADRLHHRGLQSISNKRSIVSAGKATALLWRMQSLGFIQPSDDFHSGRERRYKPLPALVAAYKRRIDIELSSLAMLDRRAADHRVRIEDPEAFRRYVAISVEGFLNPVNKGIELFQPLGGIYYKAMGMLILFSIVAQVYEAGGTVAEGTVEVSLSSIARRFGVSRAHTRRVLKSLEEVGLLRDPADPQRFTLTPRFRVAYEIYHSGVWKTMLDVIDAC